MGGALVRAVEHIAAAQDRDQRSCGEAAEECGRGHDNRRRCDRVADADMTDPRQANRRKLIGGVAGAGSRRKAQRTLVPPGAAVPLSTSCWVLRASPDPR